MADADNTHPDRTCTCCGVAFPATLENFPPHKMGKYGLHPRCRSCKKADDAARRARTDQLARQQAWRDANKDRVRKASAAYRAAGYKSTEAVAKWRRKNLVEVRAKDAAYMRERRATDQAFALKCRIRSRLGQMVKGRGSRRTEELLGYTISELRSHLERQFKRGMGWHNMSEWDVDHIIPVAAFNIETVDCPDFKACWALTNLQPLWKHENRAKSDKVLTLL